eukprot:m.375510 g.375510  ORF g.375510 m.375510 type:complete len:296 (-) comp56179_c0_seq1:3480-4367(-)
MSSRSRWALLAAAVSRAHTAAHTPAAAAQPATATQISDSAPQAASKIAFSNFGLLTQTQTPTAQLFQVCSSSGDVLAQANCHILSQPTTLEEMMGFNNTGNICIWPAEQVLAYYAATHREEFARRRVIEIGGGMTCLGALVLATAHASGLHPATLCITDGNTKSVENLQRCIAANSLSCPVTADRIVWDAQFTTAETFDEVLCADCLFFEDFHQELLRALRLLLAPQGRVLMFAPKRMHTFDLFVRRAQEFGFQVAVSEFYDPFVTALHEQHEADPTKHYDKDLHYPLKLVMTWP